MKAIKIIVLLLMMLYATISEAQTRIAFTYDAAGNPVKREIILSQKSSIAKLDTAFYSKPFTEMMGNMKITIYPTLPKVSFLLNLQIF